MSLAKRLTLLLAILVVCVGCDQATKRLAVLTLKNMPPLSFLGNTFRLEYAENSGAFLGLGATLPDLHRIALLIVFSSAVLIALAVFVVARRQVRPLAFFGYALIIAGGASNMIDRVTVGAVVDFMNVGIGGLRTGIFNVADMAIMGGLFAVMLAPKEPATSVLTAENLTP